jgi:hypothetical protein
LPRRIGERIGETLVLEEAGGAVAVAAFRDAVDFLDESFIYGSSSDGLCRRILVKAER